MGQRKKTWSFKAGEKGQSRVRVFERRTGGPLYVEWKDRLGRKKNQVLRVSGKVVTDRTIGTRIALRMAEALLDKVHENVLEALGIKPPRKLSDLLTAMHEDRKPGWKPSYQLSQARFQKNWLDWLGGDTLLSDIRASEVNKILNHKQEVLGWKPRTRNGRARYLVDAFIFAQTTLKWITEDGNLSAVTFLPLDQEGLPYEEWELDLLNEVVYEVDLRLAVAFRIARDTGRRIDAILHLCLDGILIETVWTEAVGEVELMWIAFHSENDKRGKTGWTYVTPETRIAIEQLMKTEAVRASGWLFPNRKALTLSPRRNEGAEIRPAQPEDMIELLHSAEARTEARKEEFGGKFVRWEKGRAFHGIKRASITIQASEAGTMEVAAKQAGTSVGMLQRVYHQAAREDRAEMVMKMAGREDQRRKRQPREGKSDPHGR